jgi:2-methylcitrate dehydratase
MLSRRDLTWQQLDHAYQSCLSYQYARYALALEYSDIPEFALHAAKRSILDTIGCMVGAYEAPGRPMMEAAALELGGPEEATIVGTGMRTSAMNATLINTFLGRFLDYNDLGGGGHNSDSIAPIFAVCERQKSNGKDLLRAVLTAYELGARYRGAAGKKKGFLWDIRGAVTMPAVLGRLMGLNDTQIANAIGITASHCVPLGILDPNKGENTMCKNLRLGFISHQAILACILAKQGFTGPINVAEGENGLKQALFPDMDLDKMCDFSGWQITETCFKFAAATYGAGGHLFNTINIVKEHDLKPEDIAQVNIKLSRSEYLHTTYLGKKYPRNPESADHSAHFATACAIKERAFGPDQVLPDRYTDPVILDLTEKINVGVDTSLPESILVVSGQGLGGISYASTSEIITKDGRRFSKHVDCPHGDVCDPLSDAEIEGKFVQLVERYMPATQYKAIIDSVWNLEKVTATANLMKLMVFPKKKAKK